MIYVAIILAVITAGAFVVSFFLEEGKGLARLIGAGGILLTIVLAGVASATTVQPGHVGVPIVLGSVQNYTLSEGFHFINPLASVEEMSIQSHEIDMVGAEAVHAPSSDQLSMNIDVTVLYHINAGQAPGLRRILPNYESVVSNSARAEVRNAVRHFDAVAAVSTGREHLEQRMLSLIRQRMGDILEQRDLERYTVTIDAVQLRNIALPQEIQASIQSVQNQRQQGNERAQAIRTAQQEAERSVAEAEGQRRVAVIRARRDAEARLIRARAEAEANRVLDASLTPQLLRLRAIQATQAITTNENTRTVILGSGDSQTPLIMNMGQ